MLASIILMSKKTIIIDCIGPISKYGKNKTALSILVPSFPNKFIICPLDCPPRLETSSFDI